MMGHVKIYRDEILGKDWNAYLALPNGTVVYDDLNEEEYIVFLTVPSEIALNDNVLYKGMLRDLQEHQGFSEAQAIQWADENGAAVVTKMWDAYSSEMEIAKPLLNSSLKQGYSKR